MLMPGRTIGRKMTMTQVASTLSRFVNRAVIDRTGLLGNFDLDLVYTPDQPTPNGPAGPPPVAIAPPTDGPSLFTALQEQLGLKLVATRAPVQVVVVDHVERLVDDQAAARAADAPAFEVASVKPNAARNGERNVSLTGRRFTMAHATLRELVQFAYQRRDGRLRSDSEIAGGPGWIRSDHFDIVANVDGMPATLDAGNTAAGAATPGELSAVDRVRLMMRRLLADRFKVTVHDESRTLPMYALIADRPGGAFGRQLQRVDRDCAALRQPGGRSAAPSGTIPCGGFRTFGPGHTAGRAVSMSMLAEFLQGSVGRVVADRTGLAGPFDLDLRWSLDEGPRSSDRDQPSADPGPSIFTAVREQLGLKLDPMEGPVDVLVIDHAERPTAN